MERRNEGSRNWNDTLKVKGVTNQKTYTLCRSRKRQRNSSKTMQAIAFALGCRPEIDGETLLLKHHTFWSQDMKLERWLSG